MKQAVMIIAHNNLELLRKNIHLLNNSKIDIFIHIDKSSKLNEEDILNKLFINVSKKSNIYIYKEISVNWGGFSQIEVELFLLKKVLENKNSNNIEYTHLHLISGVDMPIKTANQICEFFENNQNKEFIHFFSPIINSKIEERFKYYYICIENKWKQKENMKFCFKIINKINKFFQKIVGVNRISKKIKYQYGCNWFSITSNFAEYILENEKFIRKQFKRTICCDEVFLQTVFINSPYVDNLYINDFEDNYQSCVRLIDWNRGNPYVFRKKDYNMLMESTCMFARKFDYNTDKEIIERIYKKLLKDSDFDENY